MQCHYCWNEPEGSLRLEENELGWVLWFIIAPVLALKQINRENLIKPGNLGQYFSLGCCAAQGGCGAGQEL